MEVTPESQAPIAFTTLEFISSTAGPTLVLAASINLAAPAPLLDCTWEASAVRNHETQQNK